MSCRDCLLGLPKDRSIFEENTVPFAFHLFIYFSYVASQEFLLAGIFAKQDAFPW